MKKYFPQLSATVHGKALVYLDNAATTQKPRVVIDAMNAYYESQCANIHRGTHWLSEQATLSFENARATVQRFINATHTSEIIFTKGTTESINLVASTYGRKNIRENDEIIISAMEHHSNIVPWQMLCEEKNAKLCVIPINDAGELMVEEFEKLLNSRTRIVAITHVSNSLGSITPLKQIIPLAHAAGAIVVVDGAQAIAHTPVDVQSLDCDFYAFSAHKIYGPTGVGVLYGKKALLDNMPPYQGGGDMIASVTFEKTTYAKAPAKFEAGTPNIAGVIGLGAAIDFVNSIGLDKIASLENTLLESATRRVGEIPGIRLIGTATNKASVLSFVTSNIHAHDVSSILDREGVAIRAGHLCAQPVMKRFGVPALARASFALYNTESDIDALVKALYKVAEVFK